MITTNKHHFLLTALTASLLLGLADRLSGQTFKVLYSFVGLNHNVFKAGHEGKVWLDDFTIAFNRGFKPNEINEIRHMITERRAEIVERWLEHGRHAG